MGFVVNKSGDDYSIYDLTSNEVIGTLYNGESCYLISKEQDKKSIIYYVKDNIGYLGYLASTSEITDWIDIPYYYFEGKKIFKIRHELELFDPVLNTNVHVESGDTVYTDDCRCYYENYNKLRILGYKKSGTKEWKEFDGLYGYVDVAIYMHGTLSGEISVYGDW